MENNFHIGLKKYRINGNDYFSADDLWKYDAKFFGSRMKNAKEMIVKKKILTTSYLFAVQTKSTHTGWKISNSSVESAILFISCQWAETNVPKCIIDKQNREPIADTFNNVIVHNITDLILHLCEENDIMKNIEIRKTKNDVYYFKASDVSIQYCIPDLEKKIENSTTNKKSILKFCKKEHHYKYFIDLDKKPIMFLTFYGILKALYVMKASSQYAETVIEWYNGVSLTQIKTSNDSFDINNTNNNPDCHLICQHICQPICQTAKNHNNVEKTSIERVHDEFFSRTPSMTSELLTSVSHNANNSNGSIHIVHVDPENSTNISDTQFIKKYRQLVFEMEKNKRIHGLEIWTKDKQIMEITHKYEMIKKDLDHTTTLLLLEKEQNACNKQY